MNDAEFETHLRSLLQPVPPSAELLGRIREDLQESAAQSRIYSGRLPRPGQRGLWHVLMRDFGWACAGATAALAVLAMLPAIKAPVSTPGASTDLATPANAFEHDETTHQLVAAEDSEQLVETDDGPAREVRYSSLERHEWSNPATGARVFLEVPREDVYLLPVSLQ